MPNQTQHTPGPWLVNEISDESFHSFQVLAKRQEIALVENQFSSVKYDELSANARLIAAAPAMLEALELAEATVVRLERHNSAAGTLHVVRAAIAAATTG